MSPAILAAVEEVRQTQRNGGRSPARYGAAAVRVALAIDRLRLIEGALTAVANELEAAAAVPLFGEVARCRELAHGAREVLHRLEPGEAP